MEFEGEPLTMAVNLADCPPRTVDSGDESCMLAGGPAACGEEFDEGLIPLPQPEITIIRIAAIGNEQLGWENRLDASKL
jgi:hypothetical protein